MKARHQTHSSESRTRHTSTFIHCGEVLEALKETQSAKADIHQDGDEVIGELIIHTKRGDIRMNIDDFQAIYTGLVRLWPVVTPARAKYHQLKRQAEVEQLKRGA